MRQQRRKFEWPQVMGLRLRQILKGYVIHQHATMAAAIAFRGLFSAIPFMAVFVLLYEWLQKSLLFGQMKANEIVLQMGVQTAVETALRSAKPDSGQTTIIWLLGLVILIYGASTVFRELTLALGMIFGTKESGLAGGELWRRMLAVTLVLGLAFMLSLATGLNWFIGVMVGVLGSENGWLNIFVQGLRLSALPVLTLLTLALVYKVIPGVIMNWRAVWPGALSATLLFWGGQAMMALFLGKVDLNSNFGAAGTFAMFLLWLYYTALIVLFGAEMVRVTHEADKSRRRRYNNRKKE